MLQHRKKRHQSLAKRQARTQAKSTVYVAPDVPVEFLRGVAVVLALDSLGADAHAHVLVEVDQHTLDHCAASEADASLQLARLARPPKFGVHHGLTAERTGGEFTATGFLAYMQSQLGGTVLAADQIGGAIMIMPESLSQLS